ncbi:hypothetical protein [Sulfoacidibacillus thermotolerans]|uniref:Uncharacterized protein n=1 Tax=Sulfoacidibacillus thermotolerans TaxID=1765684 RepID=A0A2U3D740_SULT2|nr:hypothetical protein [Sulfoacidibacillus thermotolerans]PWI57081.1 hypothetical protein BM613_10550 [Sulfoacidibacillus thermotolerans]
MSRIRILPALAALLLTLIVLFGGLQVYRTYEIIQPLESQLAQIPQVRDVQVNATAQTPSVTITLGPVQDLQATYTQIQTEVENSLGGPINIVLKDHPTPSLTSAFEVLQPILYQGIAQGMYVSMVHELESSAKQQHVNCTVTMNSQDIFIQLTKDNGYLYSIVPYATRGLGGNGQ